MKIRLLSLFSLAIMTPFLGGCETCPNMIENADIGIRIHPMACVSKETKQEKSSENNGATEGKESIDQD